MKMKQKFLVGGTYIRYVAYEYFIYFFYSIFVFSHTTISISDLWIFYTFL
jgi:hypothetical protein